MCNGHPWVGAMRKLGEGERKRNDSSDFEGSGARQKAAAIDVHLGLHWRSMRKGLALLEGKRP